MPRARLHGIGGSSTGAIGLDMAGRVASAAPGTGSCRGQGAMRNFTDALVSWVRRRHGRVARGLHRAATSALGTYGAYLGYGVLHPDHRVPYRGAEASERLPGDDLVADPQS